MEIVQVLREKLLELEDKDYAEFQRKLIPNVAPETIIGVRTPELRKLAKEAAKLPGIEEYMKVLPHDYFEEYNLHGFLIEPLRIPFLQQSKGQFHILKIHIRVFFRICRHVGEVVAI